MNPGPEPDGSVELETTLIWQVLDTTDVGLLVTDAHRRILYVNGAFSRVTGYTLEEVKGRTCAFLQGPGTNPADITAMRTALDRGEPFSRVVLNYRKDGTPLWYKLRVRPMYVGGTLQYFVGVQEDYSDARAAQLELERLAYRDGLTGLANRRTFDHKLKQCVEDGQAVVLIILDLNDFKQVNDQQGHPAGDALLQRVAACLEQATQNRGTAFRIGGDEFAALFPDQNVDPVNAGPQLLEQLTTVDGNRIRAAVGTASFPDEASDVEALMRLADRRLYADKASKPPP